MIGAFVTLKFNLQYYGAAKFGLYVLLLSAWNFGIVLDFGLNTALIKRIAEYNSKNDLASLKSSVRISVLVYVILGIIILALVNLLISQIYLIPAGVIPAELKEEARTLALILGFNFFFQYLSNLFKAVYDGLEKFIYYSKTIIAFNLILVTVNLTVIILNGTLIIFAYSVLIISFFLFLFQLLTFLYSFRNVHSNPDTLKTFLNSRMFSFGINMQLSTILVSLIDPVIKYVIGYFLTINNISFYEIARRVSIAISGMFFNMYRTILPQVSKLTSREEQKEYLRREILSFSHTGVLYSVLMFGVAMLPLAVALRLWFGNDTILIFLLILALPESLNNIGYPLYSFYIGIGKVRFLSLMQLINITIITSSLTLTLFLSRSIYGLIGYFSTVLIVNIIMIKYINTTMGTDFSLWVKALGGYKILLFYVLFFTALYLTAAENTSHYLPFVIISLSGVVLYFRELVHFGAESIKRHRFST